MTRFAPNVELHSISLVYDPPHPEWTITVIERGSTPMLETNKYIRKPFEIDAVQVTEQNIQDIATWVNGEIRTDNLGRYVKVRVHRPLDDRQTKAYVGDWVLYAGTGYKVYTPRAFANSFEQVSEETVMIDPKASKKSVGSVVEEGEIVGVLEGDVVVPKRVPKKKAG